MANKYPLKSGDITAPPDDAYVVVPNDNTDFDPYFRGLYVGVTGNVSVVTLASNNTVLFVGVPAGTTLEIRGRRVTANNTTATNIIALV